MYLRSYLVYICIHLYFGGVLLNLKQLYNQLNQAIENMLNNGLEARDGQEELMYDVLHAYETNENLIVEAQVGIGKSFGYLIPGILLSKITNKPLVVSTSSIQLTEQLINDIKVVEKILNVPIESIIGKGMTNFPCFNKIYKNNLKGQLLNEALNIAYQGQTKQKVRDTNLKWSQISTDNCILDKCKYKKDCAYYEMRNRLKTGNQYIRLGEYKPKVIVVNQDMLLMNFKKNEQGQKNLIYDNPCMLIIDEVHNLEDKQRANMTNSVNSQTTINKLNAGLKRIDRQHRYLKYLREIDNWFEIQKKDAKKQLHLRSNGLTTGRVKVKYVTHHQIKRLIEITEKIVKEFDINNYRLFDQRPLITDEQLETASNLLSILKKLQNNEDKYIFWNELINQDQIAISFCQNSIAQTLRQTVFDTNYPVICLSATITNKVGGKDSYHYIKKMIGFDGYEEKIKKNNFPYEKSKLYIPSDLPKFNEREDSYYKAIANYIFELVSFNSGGSLVLFTAKEDIIGVYKELRKKELDKAIYIDDGSKSQYEIIEAFKKTKGVILGTGVFWEGIDLKKDLLTLLIIVKLPFPTIDPITKYKISKLNSTEEVIVPEMIIKLKQGVGRLIRTTQDKGLLVLLDSRMNKSIYKHKEAVLDALPIKNMIDEDEVKDFLNNI